METNTASLQPEPLKVFLRSKKDGDDTIINNVKEQNFLQGKGRWYTFEFVDPIYIQEMYINSDGYSAFDSINLQVFTLYDKVTDLKNKPDDGVFKFSVERFATGFRFKPDSKIGIFSTQKFKNVTMTGYTRDKFERLENEIGDIVESRADLKARTETIVILEKDATEKITKTQASLDSLKLEEANLTKQVAQASTKVQTLVSELASNESRKNELLSAIEDLQQNVEKLNNQRRIEEALIFEKQNEHKRLVEKLRLFPSEIGGFVEEARRTIRWYSFLTTIPIFILAYVVCYVFNNAIYLTQIANISSVNLWSLFVSRLPFVIVTVSIIQVCGTLIKRWLDEIYSVNNQRLNLSAISIVAKDVSVASSASLDMSPAEKFELETKLKMSLLREHMRKYLSEKYEYRNNEREEPKKASPQLETVSATTPAVKAAE